jgi:hypothetical protein
MVEQITEPLGPDNGLILESAGGVSLRTDAPDVRFVAVAEMNEYARRRRTIVIRHGSDDRMIALIEILSPGNKASRRALGAFVEKAAGALDRGHHLLVVDRPVPTMPTGFTVPSGRRSRTTRSLCLRTNR